MGGSPSPAVTKPHHSVSAVGGIGNDHIHTIKFNIFNDRGFVGITKLFQNVGDDGMVMDEEDDVARFGRFGEVGDDFEGLLLFGGAGRNRIGCGGVRGKSSGVAVGEGRFRGDVELRRKNRRGFLSAKRFAGDDAIDAGVLQGIGEFFGPLFTTSDQRSLGSEGLFVGNVNVGMTHDNDGAGIDEVLCGGLVGGVPHRDRNRAAAE